MSRQDDPMQQLRRWQRLFICLILGWLVGIGPRLQARESFSVAPSNLEQVDIYLHTVDVGNLIFNNFGHTAIRVHDKSSGQDLVFNWGIFDFGDPLSFSLRFYRGFLVYKLGIYPYRYVQRNYMEDGRTVWEDQLDLSVEEKRRLIDRLIWNSEEKNRDYNYQYFFDNCSTRPRDYIDEALGGTLKQATSSELTNQTFRESMVEGYSYNPGMDLLLDIGMNSRLDRPMTVWEKMFHPLALRDTLLKTENGSRPLIKSSRILAQYQRPNSYEELSYLLILFGFGVPICILGVGFFWQKLKAQAFMLRLFALIALPLMSFGALVGFLMPLNWVASTHFDLHHNANQLLFWPFDAVIVYLLLKIVWRGRALVLSSRSFIVLRTYLLAHILVSLLLPVLRALDLIHQNVDMISVYVLPPYLAILLLVLRIGLVANGEQGWKSSQKP